ncbi:SH3 domain-containing protein [Mesobacillus subterraneus]|uniref:SH3 domain-containing protein n=1 Tax=Mesobacillus subterraneus TaxID=285983 RepID=UPI001FE3F527|nr:SH3 domain-containing protein [Mesobacillus subterraneus]
MAKIKKISVYFLILMLLLQGLPYGALAAENMETAEMPAETKAVVAAGNEDKEVPLYEEPDIESEILAQLADGTEVTVIAVENDYTSVLYENTEAGEPLTGYIASENLVDASLSEEVLADDEGELSTVPVESKDETSVEGEPAHDTEAGNEEGPAEQEEAEVVPVEEEVKISDSIEAGKDQSSEEITKIEEQETVTEVDQTEEKQTTEVTAQTSSTPIETKVQRTSLTVSSIEEGTVENYQGIALSSPTNIYQEASTGSKVIKSYAQGSILYYQSFNNDWYQATVFVGGQAQSGYIKSSDVENLNGDTTSYKGLSLKAPTIIYSKASRSSSSLKKYNQGTILYYKAFSSEWYQATVYISGQARTGYIHKSDVENLDGSAVSYKGIALKAPTIIYSQPSVSSAALKQYSQGTLLYYRSFSSSWYQATVYISGKARTGYIHKSDVENATANPVDYKGVALKSPTKVYKMASTSSSALKSYSQGKILYYKSFTAGWYQASVVVNGVTRTGYISVNDVESAVETSSSFKVRGIVSKVNVYSYTSSSASVLKSYGKDTILIVKNFTSSWYQATVYINGKARTGYIKKSDTSTDLQEPSYLNADLRKSANLTAQDIVDFFNRRSPNSPLKNYAQSFINVQNKYGVNAAYLVAHTIWETGWGGSNLMTYKNNLYGYGAYDVCPFTCGYYYPTIEDSINSVAYMVRVNYLNPTGAYYYEEYGSTLTGMNVRYATDQNWKNGIANLMQSIKPFDSRYYSSASILPLNAGQPGSFGRDIPKGLPYPTSIIKNFPQGTTATIMEDAKFRTLPYTSASTIIGTLSSSTKVTVLGYNTDVRTTGSYPYDHTWYRISFNGTEGWVYGKLIDIDNLLKVVNVSTTLNIRSAPVDGTVVGSVAANGYLKAVLNSGKPVTDQGWYKVYLPGSTSTGWVSGEFINIIKN